MKTVIRELVHPDEVRALEPMVLEYFRIVTGELEKLGVSLAPEEPVADMMASLDKFVPPLGRAYVAEADGTLLGMAFLKPLESPRVELKRLYVRDAARGTGLGRRLLHHTMGAARSLGLQEMLLDTIHPLEQAIALYEAEGFKRIGAYAGSEIAVHDAILPHALFMSKDL